MELTGLVKRLEPKVVCLVCDTLADKVLHESVHVVNVGNCTLGRTAAFSVCRTAIITTATGPANLGDDVLFGGIALG